MIKTDKYDDEGIELSDGGTIYYPDSEGRIERVDYWGNTMEVRYPNEDNYDDWNDLMGDKAWKGEEE